jgi:hypothetical protein
MMMGVHLKNRNKQGEMNMASFKSMRLGHFWSGLGLAVMAVAGFVASRLTAPQPVLAMATHGSENLTAVTAPVEGQAEAIVYLDHVTGELTGYVLSTTTWNVIAKFTYPSVNADLQLNNVKNPKFTVVTGMSGFKPKGGQRIGTCAIYVAEETTGMMVAYGIPLEAGSMNAGRAIQGNFRRLTLPLKVSSAVRRGGGGEVGIEEVKEPPKKGKKEK